MLQAGILVRCWLVWLQVRALRTLAAVCTISLSQFSSVAPEDLEMLKLGMDSSGQPVSPEMNLALQFRLEKKKLLLHTVNEISKQIQVTTAARALTAEHMCLLQTRHAKTIDPEPRIM